MNKAKRSPKTPRAAVGIDCSNDPPLTKQNHRDECDINKIIARFDRTGLVTHVRDNQGQYLDVSDVGTYREAMHRVIAVENSFMQLSAADRAKFNNDPATYLDWASQEPSEEPQAETVTSTPDEQPAVSTSTPDTSTPA